MVKRKKRKRTWQENQALLESKLRDIERRKARQAKEKARTGEGKEDE